MAKTPDTSRDRSRKRKRPSGPDEAAGAPVSKPAAKEASKAKAGRAKAGKPARAGTAIAGTPPEAASKAAGKSAKKSPKRPAKRPAKKPAKRVSDIVPDVAATPVVIQAKPTDVAVTLPDTAVPRTTGKKPGKRASARRPPPQTFLVAATLSDGESAASLGVYAVVTRTPAEALAAVRDLVGPEVPVGLTGKLSGRMAKALGLKPGEVRRI